MDQKDVIENLKIAIIYGRDIVDGENKDGVMEKNIERWRWYSTLFLYARIFTNTF